MYYLIDLTRGYNTCVVAALEDAADVKILLNGFKNTDLINIISTATHSKEIVNIAARLFKNKINKTIIDKNDISLNDLHQFAKNVGFVDIPDDEDEDEDEDE